MPDIRVRFAPSPTGKLHIGSLRTALFNWLFARHNNGTLVLRIEDTDRERYVEGSVEYIIEVLKWSGLYFDEGPIFQSKRTEIYTKFARQLVEQGNAYYCFCTHERLEELRKVQIANKLAPRYDGHCRTLSDAEVKSKIDSGEKYVIRMKIPAEGVTEFDDIIRGHVSIANKDIDDQVLLKSDGFPTYHLANVVDDRDERISHVIRAEEWLPSTPKHLLLYRAFGWTPPEYAHLSMVLGTDRSKLSKRHGATAALEYRDLGYLPEAVINFIALLGWNPKTDREIFSKQELIKEFDLANVNKSGAIFNVEKLDWLNSQYIKKMPTEELAKRRRPYYEQQGIKIQDEKVFTGSMELEQDRLTTLNDPSEIASFIFSDSIQYDPELLVPKNETMETTSRALALAGKKLTELPDDSFQTDRLKTAFGQLITAEKLTNKQMLWPLRVAVTGLARSPGVFEVMAVLGKAKSAQRIEQALLLLKK